MSLLLLASFIFWAITIICGGAIVICLVGAIFDCENFTQAAIFTGLLAVLFLIIWGFGWSGHYLAMHHVWPWN